MTAAFRRARRAPLRGVSVATLVAVACSAGAIAVTATPAAADAAYEANASATGFGVQFTNESVPLGVTPQVQGPTAQASQTSLQQSDAYAAFPDPGQAVAGLPGVAGGAVGVAVPPYPFAVSTAFGDGVEQLSYPGTELRAESGETITQAAATAGSTGAGATSRARVANDAGAISATANSDADALRLGKSLIISGLHAAATASRDTAGKLERSSSLSFTSLSAPNLALTLPAPPGATTPPQRIAVPSLGLTNGQFSVTVPGSEPAAVPVPAEQALAALTQAGYQATYQAPQETENGIIGAGLRLSTTLPAPPPGAPGGLSGETPVTLTLGLARAEISYTALPDSGAEAGLPLLPPAEEAPAPASAPAGAPSDTATGTAGTAAGTLPAPVAGPATGALPQTPLPSTALPGGTVPQTGPAGGATGQVGAGSPTVDQIDLSALRVTRAAIGSDIGWIYLMLVAVGGAAFAAVFVLHHRLAAAAGPAVAAVRSGGVRR